jgi:hypothetical protein
MTHATADLPSLLNDASSKEEVQSCDAGLQGVVFSKSEQHKKVQGANFQGACGILELETSRGKAVEEGDVLLEANADPAALKFGVAEASNCGVDQLGNLWPWKYTPMENQCQNARHKSRGALWWEICLYLSHEQK